MRQKTIGEYVHANSRVTESLTMNMLLQRERRALGRATEEARGNLQPPYTPIYYYEHPKRKNIINADITSGDA